MIIDVRTRRALPFITAFVFALFFVVWVGANPSAAEEPCVGDCTPVSSANVESIAKATAPQVATIVQRLALPRGATAVAWSPDGKTLATVGGLRQQIMLWEARSGKLLSEHSGNFGGEQGLAFSNDGKLLLVSGAGSTSADQDTAVVLWDVATSTIAGRVVGPFPGEGAMANSARAIAVDREHDLMAIVASQDPGGPVAIYDMRKWTLKGTVAVEGDTPQSLAFSRDGTLAVGTVLGRIALFDAQNRHLKHTIKILSFVHSLAFSPDGSYVAGGFSDVAIRIWRTTDGTLVSSYLGRFSDVKGLAWSPDGRYLATASFDRVVRLWPADRSAPPLASFNFRARSAAFSPDGTFLAAAGTEGAIIIQIK